MRIYAVAFLAAASCAVANPHRIRKGHARRNASSTSHGRVLQKDDAQAKNDLMSLSMSFPDTTEAPLVTEASGKDDGEDAMSMPPAETTEAPAETTDAFAEGKEQETDDEMSMPVESTEAPGKEDGPDDEMSMPAGPVDTTEPPGKEQVTDDEMSMPVETTEAPGKEDGPDDEMSMPAGPVDTTEAPGKEQETDDEMSMPVETTEAPGKEDGPDDEMSMPSPPVGTTEVPLSTGTTSFAVTTSSTPIDVESLPDEILSISMPETTESDSSSDVDTNMSVDSSTVDSTQAPEDVDEEGPAGDDKFSQEADPVISNIEKSSSVVLGSSAAAIAITGAMIFI